MLRTRILAILMTFALVACSETPSAPVSVIPGGILPPGPPPNQSAQLTGKVVTNAPPLDNAVYLELDDQSRVILVGSQVSGLSSVNGAVVFVEGNWSDGYAYGDIGVIEVQRFEVLAVGGRPAIDGILEETPEGYALRLQNGDFYTLVEPSAEMLEHMGQRLWITTSDTGAADAFGVISS